MNEFAVKDVRVNKNTVVDWYMFCREVCMVAVLNESELLGGEGKIVEIDESMFGKMKVVPNQTKEELLSVIKEWMVPGSVINSDCWKAYNCLSRVNNSLTSKDPETGAPTYSIEGTWSAIKRSLRNHAAYVEGEFDHYLAEYMWRRRRGHSMDDDVFQEFLRVITTLYPPMEKDIPSQFESSLFKALSKLLGVQKCRTTGYHPQANEMIEELHRPLKSAIKCHATERWTEVLPIILLGIRASFKEDILCTPAEIVFGTTIRLPGGMTVGSNTCFSSYDGPFKVLQRKDKVFFLDINGKRVSVSIDRCKPAFFLNTEDLQLPQTKNETPATVEPNATASTPATVESDPTASTPTQPSTRSDRKVHLPTSDEAHFWLNGYVNKQNCRIWSEANPQVYVETPLNPEKLTVWCALWAGGILLQKRSRPQRYSQW
ncbi:mitotic-spindle organizing protein 2A [Trichonephila clavipes]|nr:mitotic-spindle organizing protein 2A [Trichonephila clavipes]